VIFKKTFGLRDKTFVKFPICRMLLVRLVAGEPTESGSKWAISLIGACVTTS